MELLARSEAGLRRAAEVVLAGGLVVYPTETLYGLGADALNPQALARVVAAKGRLASQPIPLLVRDRGMLARVVRLVPPAAEALIERHWPGPLTLVLPAVTGLSPALVGPGGGVGVRISSDPVASELVGLVNRPITATSANRTGAPPAVRADQLVMEPLEGVELVVDDGHRGEQASTVVELLDGSPARLLRQGAVRVDLAGGA